MKKLFGFFNNTQNSDNIKTLDKDIYISYGLFVFMTIFYNRVML